MSGLRFGASFVDRATGLRFEVHHPASRPDRWHDYLVGAAREYERYGIGKLVDFHALERGDGVSLFFVGVDDHDRVVAGLRCHGPLDRAAGSQALAEMAASPEWEQHRDAVASITPYGVVEMKGAWRELSGDGNALVAGPMVRCCVHAVEWLGAEVLLAAVADRMEPILASVGGIMMGSEASAYPSERYRTILTGLRRARYRGLIDDTHARLLREDAEQLRQSPGGAATTGWRPVVLDSTRRADRQILANLRSDPGIEVLDVAERAVEELRALVPSVDPELLEEPALHVYYPWRRAVVRMLGPRAFALLRLDRNRNRITCEEQERLRRQRVGVVGLSSGHSVAAAIALEGICGELRLADFDDIELTNLNRLPATVLDVGVNKAVAAARRIAELDPYLAVRIEPKGLSAENAEDFLAGLDVVVEECDDIAVKLLVREVARRQRVPVLMATSDRGLVDVERFDQEPDRPILHGLLGDVTAASAATMTMAQKVPLVLGLVGPEEASARGAASLVEIGGTVSTWPQLASEVTVGAATIAATVRHLGLGDAMPSGRARIDLDAVLSSLESPLDGAGAASAGAASAGSASAGSASAGSAGAGPGAAVPLDVDRAIVHAATLAPSCGNGQPWRFELSSRELAIELDGSRTCGTMDVRSRATYVGLGAALFNARVAAAAAGRLGAVELFPHGPSSAVVASVALGAGSEPSLAELRGPMLERCSNRRHGTPSPLDLAIAQRLSGAAATEHAQLHLISDTERLTECAAIFAAGERIRFLNPTLRTETLKEMRWPGQDVRTGIDVATLELSVDEAVSLKMLGRQDVFELLARWDAGGALGDYLARSMLSSSAIAIVTVENSSSVSYLSGGMALERVWIEAQRAGLAVQAIAPAFLYAVQERDFDTLGGTRWAGELHALSARFRRLIDLGIETAGILALRLSHAPPPRVRSARLPLEEVLRRRTAP